MLNLSHKKLDVYQLSLQLVKEIYFITKNFPKEEMYVLNSQVRRAAVLVSSNIAEGASRVSKLEKRRFYVIARSSLVEIDTQFEIAKILNYHKFEQPNELEQKIEPIFKMLSKMIENLSVNSTSN